MCLDIARDAMRMHRAGLALKEIRAAIESRYGINAKRRTATELPPS